MNGLNFTSNSILEKFSDRPVFDVTKYGILPDTGEDLYNKLFVFLHNVVSPEFGNAEYDSSVENYVVPDPIHDVTNIGGVVYFPQGEYIISDSIFIPPNTTFLGCGPSTKIKFTEEYFIYDETTQTYKGYGVALSNGGSNVSIQNMTVDCNRNDIIDTSGAMSGSIGFGSRVFSYWTLGHKSASSNAPAQNLSAVDIWTNTRYVLQTETSAVSGYIKNIQYRNIHARNSLVSVMNSGGQTEDSVIISDVVIDNVECAWLRIGLNSVKLHKNIFISNVRTGRMFLMGGDIYVDNCFIFPELKYDSILYSGAINTSGNLSISNSYFEVSNYKFAFIRQNAAYRFSNVVTRGSTERIIYYPSVDGINPADLPLNKINDIVGCDFENNGSVNTLLLGGKMESTRFPSLGTSATVYSYHPPVVRITGGQDLNDFVLYGHYFMSASNASTVNNRPESILEACYLFVYTHEYSDSPNYVMQKKIVTQYGDKVYLRCKTNNNWNEWRKFEGTTLT